MASSAVWSRDPAKNQTRRDCARRKGQPEDPNCISSARRDGSLRLGGGPWTHSQIPVVWFIVSHLNTPRRLGRRPTHFDGQRRRKRPLIRQVVTGFLLVAFVFLISATNAAAQPVTRETWIAERTNPAVQLIQTTFTATVSSRQSDLSKAGVALFDLGIYKWRITRELDNPDQVLEYVFDRIATNPTYYLREVGQPRRKTLTAYATGSGWVADPRGYVVTAKHVITSSAEVTESFADQGAEWFAKADAKTWVNIFKDHDLSSETVEKIVNAIAAFDAENLKVRVGTPKVSVILGTASADGSRVGKPVPAEVVYRSSSDLGEDVAVLRMHVGESQQLPSLALASTGAAQGEPVFLAAFPGLPDRSEAALLQPTVTSGQITAIKPNEAGLQLLQHNATASAGASGAAALNPTGKVIGIHVAGAFDAGGRVGQGYLMPLDSVRSALSRSGATQPPGETTTLYNEALDLFYNDHFQASLDKFRKVKELFPAHAYAGGYIARAQLAISQGKDVPVEPPRKPVPWTLILIGAGAGLLVLASGGAGYGLSRRSRRKSERAEIRAGATQATHMESNSLASMPGYSQFDNGSANMSFGSAHAAEYGAAHTGTGTEDEMAAAGRWDPDGGPDSIPDQDHDADAWAPIMVEGFPQTSPGAPQNQP
jgi:serine protease Do